MEIKTLEDIQELVKEYREIKYPDGNFYFTIGKELANETEKWLYKYSHSKEGRWLDYEIAQSTNEPEIYILIFFD